LPDVDISKSPSQSIPFRERAQSSYIWKYLFFIFIAFWYSNLSYFCTEAI